MAEIKYTTPYATDMTANNAPAPLITSASQSNWGAYKAFSSSLTDDWSATSLSADASQWVQIQLDQAIRIWAVKIGVRTTVTAQDAGQVPYAFKIHGSNDGENFTEIYSQTQAPKEWFVVYDSATPKYDWSQPKFIELSNTATAYKYYRFEFFNCQSIDKNNATTSTEATNFKATYIQLFQVEGAAITHTVTFCDWDGTTLKTEVVADGENATPPTVAQREGYAFIGWDGSYTNVTADITLTAQYAQIATYTVTFQDWDGSILKTQTVQTGQSATPPANPIREDYTFTGWDKPYSSITADTIVTATYSQIVMHTVSFQDWDGTVLKSETVEHGGSATPPPDPSRESYTFTGWDKPYTNIQADTVITAQYRSFGVFLVTFMNWDATTFKIEYVLEGGTATAPTVPEREGYDHSGWDVPFDNVLSDIVTTAQFTPKVYHTVCFLDWDEEVLKTEQVEHGHSATAPEAPIRAGYRFVGWDSPGTEILSDLDIHALYEQIIYYTVRFLDWDEAVLKTETVQQGGTATPPANPTRSGYTFTGWLPAVFTNVNADKDFTAQYKIIIVYHTVHFFSDGTLLSTMQVEDGDAAIPPLPPKKADYIFDHWDADFSHVTADMTVNAVYRAALDHTVILIYSASGILLQTIDRVLSATLRDSLDGELTFDFSTLAARGQSIMPGCVAEYEGCFFNIVRVAKSIFSGMMVTAVSCEHISYVLNDDRYKIENFDFTGDPSVGMAQLLIGTQFAPGVIEYSGSVTMKINTAVTRRAALMQFIAIMGGEIEYDGHLINVRTHRGSTTVKQLLETKNVTDVSVTYEGRASAASYEVAFHKVADCAVGDEVHIVFSPLGVDTSTRIIAMEYNPFYRYSIRVEVGDYKPTINDSLYRIEKITSDNSDDMSEIWNSFDDFSSDFDSFQTDYGNFMDTYKEVQNIAVGSASFTVTYSDGSMATFNYSVDANGRMTGITRVV